VTVVIPTCNGGPLLKKTLEAVLDQNTSFEFDILVIDSASNDGSIEEIQNLPRVMIKRITRAEFGHGKTRNLGAELASGEFVAYLTQDAIPANRYWLENLVQPIIYDGDIAGVFGAHIAHPYHSPLADMELFHHFYSWLASNHVTPIKLNDERSDAIVQDHQRFYSDNNSCLRKSVWKTIPYPDITYGEDQLWAEQILKAGYKKAFAPMAIVYHSHEYGFREALLRANTEWHFFNECLGKKLPHSKSELLAMIDQCVASDNHMSQSLGLTIDRRRFHFARAAGYYLAGRGHGCLRP
jgi:glycosyltransferase involved in cell wall biosynthesis